MPEYLTPGVYVEEVSFRAPSIEGVGTSTTGFAGVTLTGPTGATPELLTSFGDYQNIYGGYDNLTLSNTTYPNHTAIAVKGFFDNGGSQLYVSRVFVPTSPSNSGVASSGSPSSSNVVVSARFPGAIGNQSVTVRLKTARTQNVGSLPAGSLVASAPNISTLGNPVTTADKQITLALPLPWGAPTSVLVDSEVMTVTTTDSTGTILTVTRAAPAAHASGAVVMGQLGYLFGALNSGGLQLTISSNLQPAATTPAPTTTGTGTTPTTTPAPATTPASATAPSNGIPAVLQIDAETFFVTQVDSTGTVITLNHAAAASHTANTPVFAPVSLFANGASGPFQSGTTPLASVTPPGLYVLTMQVTANTAAESAAVFDGLGFDPAHPYYLGTVLGATPPRHVDALQNQIAFIIGNNSSNGPLLSPSALFQNMFPNWGGPTANASRIYTLTGGNDGLEPESTDYDNALALFTSLEDIAIVGAPGSGAFDASQDIINSLITHVSQQRAYRVAVLETPPNQLASDNEGVRALIDTSYAALYAPWVLTPNPLATTGSAIPAEIAVPPTGFIAGIWARSDEENGVSKAPANEVILGASRLERDITFAEQGILNPLGINCLRYFPNRGFRVWGSAYHQF